jgi:nucleoid-associated protein YgaU
MKYSPIILVFLFVFLLTGSLFVVSAQETGTNVPLAIRNNNYYRESLRLTNLARLASEDGDYDSSISYSEEAIRYAELSDAFVKLRLKMWETDRAIYTAGRRLEYAASINAASRYPDEYREAQAAYGDARSFRAAESWDDAIEAARRVLAALSGINGGGAGLAGAGAGSDTLPAQYTVRTWVTFKDCLWNIAGRPWAYNDPYKWKVLYEMNKDKLPESDNPDLIEPGMVLDIPSIKGEIRQGMWDPYKNYSPLE